MLKDLVFFTQTDTTIGFVSQNADKLTPYQTTSSTQALHQSSQFTTDTQNIYTRTPKT